MNDIQNTYLNLIVLIALCMSMPIHTGQAYSTRKRENDFDHYLLEGNLSWTQRKTTDDELNEIRTHIQKPVIKVTDNAIKEFCAQYVEWLKNNQLFPRQVFQIISVYSGFFNTFTLLCAHKQMLLLRIAQCEENDNFSELTQDFKAVEGEMRYVSKCLFIARSSGLESQLLRCSLPQYDYKADIFKNTALGAHLHEYLEGEENSPRNSLSPTSMAILRHQLYEGLEEDYKDHINISRTYSVCRLKFKQQPPCDCPYKKFEKLLALADKEANELNTELLWQ